MLFGLQCTIAKKYSLKHLRTIFSIALAIFINNAIATTSPAVRYPDGKLAFESAVFLLNTSTTFNSVRVRQAKYYFDLELPLEAKEPLGKVIIQQRQGSEDIDFKPEKTKAYFGSRRDKQAEIDLTANYNSSTGEVIVNFDRPILPGNKITIALRPKRNPNYTGIYLFGVTAFPPGNRSLGLYLGSGRLQFYQNNFFHH